MEPPSVSEVSTCVSLLKCRRAVGPDNLPHALSKDGGGLPSQCLSSLLESLWGRDWGTRNECGKPRGVSSTPIKTRLFASAVFRRIMLVHEAVTRCCLQIRNEAVRESVFGLDSTGTSTEECVPHQKLRWLGHALRIPNDRLSNRFFFSCPIQSGWGPGDPYCAWLEMLQDMTANRYQRRSCHPIFYFIEEDDRQPTRPFSFHPLPFILCVRVCKMTQWLECEFTDRKVRTRPLHLDFPSLGLGNLAVSQPSYFPRVAWQLGTERVLQVNDYYYYYLFSVFGHPTAIPVGPTHLDWPGPETLGTVFDNRCLRTITRVGWCRRIRNKTVRKRVLGGATGTSIEECAQHQMLRWFGHVLRMPNHRLLKRVLFSVPNSEWRKQRGSQPVTWQRDKKEIVKSLGAVGAIRLPGWKPRDPHCVWRLEITTKIQIITLKQPELFINTVSTCYMYIRNALLIRLLKLLRQPTTGFALLGAHQVHPGGSSNTPITLEFPSSAVYGDLLSNLQNLVLPANQPPSVQLTAAPTNSPALSALRHHLKSIRVTDQCFQLITTNWPRQTLPRCTTLNVEDAHDSNACLTQSLVSLGLSDGSGVSVRHVSANCPFEAAVVAEQTHTVSHPSTENPAADLLPNDPSRDADSEPDTPPPGNEFSLAFPPGGQQLVPQPPGGYMPRSGRTLMENLRHRAAVLDAEFHQRAMSNPCREEDLSVSESHWGSPLRLEDLTFRRLLELLVYYLQRLTRGSQGLDDPSSDQHRIDEGTLLHYAINSMSGPWPERLGQKLIGELREQSLFNIKTASLLRNCVTSLNLNYYPLVTTELITCLVSKWPHLTELQLNGLQTGQIQPETVDQLGALRNLRLLSLNGLSSVCDRNIGTLINLPELRILRLAGTSVTDAGWIQMAASSVTSSRPLAELDASGLRNNLTSRGLEAIVQLFPNLHHLTIAASEITTDLPDAPTWSASPLTLLTNLDISECTLLVALPAVLLPPPAPSRTTGLRILKLHQCSSLDLTRVLDQLRGHPLQHLDGLESIPSLDASLLERYCASGFSLTELHLRRINFSWMVQSTALRARILATTPTHSLLHLSFPLRKTNPPADSGECSPTSVLSQLGRFHRLQTLDLGGQISKVAHLVVGAERIPTCQSVTVAAIIVSEDDPAARCVLLSAPPDTLWTNLFDARPLSHVLRSSPNLTLLLNAAMFHSHPPVRSFSPSIPIPDGMCADLGTVTTTEPVSRCNRTRGFTQAAFSSPHNEVDNREKQLRETGENAWTQTLSDHLKQRCEEAVNYRTQVRFRRGGHVDQRNPAFHTGVDDNSQTVDSKPQQTKVAVDADPSAQMDMGIL
ncbi:hypothetical protein CSKR_109303 [Clonorchis sinensis]|uniref:Uncharacterized protein n=1 Tax=Clonorchis sinensis TaxID=79923 RepID=A0A8T1M0G7_CLOSI|nr:hypothetical protein CSKR_109303 [Clonorchis sinensis]